MKALVIFGLASLLGAPLAAIAQAPDAPAKASGGLVFDLGGSGGHTVKWFTREADAIESTITRVVTPVTTRGVTRLEVYTDIEVRQAKNTIQRSSEKRVYNAADMRPISSRIDIDYIHGAALQKGWRELTYEQGRVKGTLIDAKGTRREIDKEVPAGALIAPWVAISFLAADQLAPDRVIPFQIFNENTEAVEDGQFKVLKQEKVNVLGEQYDAWKIEVRTGRTTATAHYTTTIPRILLRLRDNRTFQEMIEMSK